MHRWTVHAARVALVAAAISVAGAGIANADDTRGDHSLLGGEQIHIPIIAPFLFGNRINANVLSSVPSGARLSNVRMDGTDPAYAPEVDICGNAISSGNGVGTASCKGPAKIGGNGAAPVAHAKRAWAAPQASPATAGAPATGVGAVDQPVAAPAAPDAPAAPSVAPSDAPATTPADIPATAPSDAPVVTPAEAPAPEAPVVTPAEAPAPEAPVITPADAPEAAPSDVPAVAPAAAPAAETSTSGQNGFLAGNQVKAPVRIPIRICGNAAALGGVATASCEGTVSSGRLGGARGAFRALGIAGPLY
jgi:hypothetical protein